MDSLAKLAILLGLPLVSIAAGLYWLFAEPRWTHPRQAQRDVWDAHLPPSEEESGGQKTLSYAPRHVGPLRPVVLADVPPLRVTRACFAVAAGYALIANGLVAAAWLHARLTLGHWPRPYQDPVTPLADGAAQVSLCGCPMAHPLVVGGIVYLLVFRLRDRLIGLMTATFGCAMLALHLALKFGRFFEWVID